MAERWQALWRRDPRSAEHLRKRPSEVQRLELAGAFLAAAGGARACGDRRRRDPMDLRHPIGHFAQCAFRARSEDGL